MAKPFDLQKAMAGHPLVTRDGRDVTEFCYFRTRSVYKVVAIIYGDLCAYLDNGMTDNRRENNLDLFLKSEKKKLFVNIHLTPNKFGVHAASNAFTEPFDVDSDHQIVEVEIDV